MEGIKKKLTQLRLQADEAYLRETQAKEEAAKAREETDRVREIALQRKARAADHEYVYLATYHKIIISLL